MFRSSEDSVEVPRSSIAPLVAAMVALAVVVAGLPGLGDIGVTWDEPRYFLSVERIQTWATHLASLEWRDALSTESIRLAWDSNRYYDPHPPVYKIGMAITDGLFGGTLGVPASYRLSSLLMLGVLIYLVVRATARVSNSAAGLTAGLSLVLMPRVFGHAHIAATDLPLTFFWFAATVGFFEYVRRGRRGWLIVGGIYFGLGLATKFTAFLLPLALLPWMVLAGDRRRSIQVIAYGTVLALFVALLMNPGAWLDPMGYQIRLIRESLSREVTFPILTHYRGRSFGYVVPWDHPIVMSVITTPVAILAIAAVGAKNSVRESRTRGLALLCLFQIIFWIVLIALPSSPNHDGVRLWLPMFPFVAVLAGLGFGELRSALTGRLSFVPEATATVFLGLLYFGPPLVETVRSYPFYLAYYGEVVGGAAGANRRGMEATYWFDAVTKDFRRELEVLLPDSARVLAYPSHAHFQLLQHYRLIREDLTFTDKPPADYLLLTAKKAKFDTALYLVWSQKRPILSTSLDGVELAGLYSWEEVEAQLAAKE